jgi:hypothetical protein
LNFLYSEKIPGTFNSGATDGNKGIGSNASNLYKCTFAALWQGANGENTDAAFKALFGDSGWMPPWSL